MSRNVILSESREVPLLLFLWKWKVSTTAALIQRFFPNCKGKTAYNRILALRQAGFIRIRADGQGQKFVCSLDKKGFEAIRQHLPYLKEEGYQSEQLGHDLLVAAFHLGNWLLEKPKNAALFSEQELRRFDPEFYPKWVPKSTVHHPDGYSLCKIRGEQSVCAFEAELHYKRDSDYSQVAEFYDHFHTISRVFWLVPRESMAHNLYEKLTTSSTRHPSPHCFILFEEFKHLGWNSRICAGRDQGQTLSGLFLEIDQKSNGNLPDLNLVPTLLDTRKSPHISNTYRGYQMGDFTD